ncbi:hemolysin-type calcium binding protein [Enhygromyxa salina]|uniref:Hemolysin-type calcium binding protein n=1 Tax=Enhygromyxa salina TaxID=215803 RepID=A0A0C2D4N3_9BACT|nr:calcium-binding protein [Enhygromyxa salina]KIG16645.1 hemolysin-type calcium binding protein [Enhygromyxa salina]
MFSAGCDSETVVVEDGADEVEEGDGDGDPLSDVPIEPEDEPCADHGEAQSCETEAAAEGTQFCTFDSDFSGHWGECLTSYECLPDEERDCGLAGTVRCQLDKAGVPYFPACPFTPLVLSFDAGPVALASNAASFDMDGAGMCLNTDWPATDNPWLAIDLDHNGFIDGGHELFGSGSVLGSGRRADNGFIALATLDSNHDGSIDMRDAQFGEILVWRDEDGDKTSLPGELSTLAEAGVESINLDYFVREHCDERSNCGRERSRFEFHSGGQLHVGEVVDVHLPCQ